MTWATILTQILHSILRGIFFNLFSKCETVFHKVDYFQSTELIIISTTPHKNMDFRQVDILVKKGKKVLQTGFDRYVLRIQKQKLEGFHDGVKTHQKIHFVRIGGSK